MQASQCSGGRILGLQRTHNGVQQQLAKVVDALAQQRRKRDVHRQRLHFHRYSFRVHLLLHRAS